MLISGPSKKFTGFTAAAVVFALLLCILPMKASAAHASYIHNPVLNARAMEDIIVDDNAVYGFRPDPASERLGAFADMDWSDPATVEAGRQQRIEYHNQFDTMYDKWQEMEAEGKTTEEIARTVSAMRNEIRLASYDNDPEGLAHVKASNLAKYGDENGPTAESLYEKYGSWETVLLKAFSENPGMDACLGLYDIYYENYIMTGSLDEISQQTYTVRSNDSLSSIAQKYFGDPARWTEIYNDNKNQISNPNIIYSGQQLTVTIK